MHKIITFSYKLISLNLFLFIIHLGVLHLLGEPYFDNHITESYCVNVLLAQVIYAILYLRRIPQHDVLGFLYMGGSMLKFAVFFAIFHPRYIHDGEISNLELVGFLVPYSACLIYKTIALIRLLNPKE